MQEVVQVVVYQVVLVALEAEVMVILENLVHLLVLV
jgi:hypothetical protein